MIPDWLFRHPTARARRSARLGLAAAFAVACIAPPSLPQTPGGTVSRTTSPTSPPPATPAALGRHEREDLGVRPVSRLHAGEMHGATPTSIPGGQVITTQGLAALYQGQGTPFVVVDVLGQPRSLPNAVPGAWLSQPGSFDDAIQQQAGAWLGQLSQQRKDVPLVFYCLSRECWMSYNAALRAIRAGHRNVLWYRGGIEAWMAAGLPIQGAAGNPAASTGAFAAVNPLPAARTQSPSNAAPPPALTVAQGRFFHFAVPPGWRIGEEGQYAVSLSSPDQMAMTLMVGNSGLPLNTSPAQFAHRKLSASGPRELNLGQGRQARPLAGFSQAVEFDVNGVSSAGQPVRGIVKVSMAPGYDSTVMVVTAAAAAAEHWPRYASWLPTVADQVAATDGAAFGRRGIMEQNLRNSAAFGQAAAQYRAWSQQNWQQVTDERNASADRQNFHVRENLGAVRTWRNPYGSAPPVQLPTTYSHYWVDRQGNHVGTNDPSADPNVGSTGEWRRLERDGPR